MSDFTGSFFIAIASICCTGFSVLLGYCFKMKISNCKMCGFEVNRDVYAENQNIQSDFIPNMFKTNEPNSRRNST